jgi:thioredoxin-related protein
MYDLEIARKNRIGHTAGDFTYTLNNGKQGRLHNIEADYTLIMFSNPGCPMCREIMDEITASPLLNEMHERGNIEILSVYPDEDIEAWRDYLREMPKGWIVSYDKGMVITNERLYNLNAIPSLYLLDSQKRVLVKDGTNVAYIEDVISYLEAQE